MRIPDIPCKEGERGTQPSSGIYIRFSFANMHLHSLTYGWMLVADFPHGRFSKTFRKSSNSAILASGAAATRRLAADVHEVRPIDKSLAGGWIVRGAD